MSSFLIVPVQAQPVINSGWTDTPPTIDGVLAPGEWDDATMIAFTFLDPIGNPTGHGGLLFVMNNGIDLFIALKFGDDDTHINDCIGIAFDNDNVGPLTTGDDGIGMVYKPPLSFIDTYFLSGGPPGWPEDVIGGGTTDGNGWRKQDAVLTWCYEMSHPLDSLDDTHDFSLSLGDSVGFALFWMDFYTGGYQTFVWPANFEDLNVEGDFGEIRIAEKPDPHPVGGIIFQIDKLTILTPYLLIALTVVTATTILIKKRKH